jgi:hypothetical protein
MVTLDPYTVGPFLLQRLADAHLRYCGNDHPYGDGSKVVTSTDLRAKQVLVGPSLKVMLLDLLKMQGLPEATLTKEGLMGVPIGFMPTEGVAFVFPAKD